MLLSGPGKQAVPDPVQHRIIFEVVSVKPVYLAGQPCRVGKPDVSCGHFFFGIEGFDDPGGIAGGYGIGRDGTGHHGAGTDNTVLTDGNPFTNDGTVSDPCIFFNPHRSGPAPRDSVVEVMPIRIRDIGIAGDHTIVFDDNFLGTADPDTRADKAVVTDFDAPGIRAHGPYGKPHPVVRCGNDIDAPADLYGRTEQFHMPGFHECKIRTQGFQLRPQEMLDIDLLKSEVQFF